MNNKDLMKAVGDIDDSYVSEAAQSEQSGVKKTFIRGRRWTKWAGAVAALLVLAILGSWIGNSGLFTNFKAADKKDEGIYYTTDDQYAYEASDYSYAGVVADGRKSSSVSSNMSVQKPDAYEEPRNQENEGSTVYNPSNVKLIYTATVVAQTTDFAAADADLRARVERAGGYFENQNVSNGSYYNGGYLKKASYKVRVPAEIFDEFVSGIKEGVTVKSLEQTTEDIGLAYSETEQRLETLRIKLARLQDLLRQATNMSDIITIENEISYTEESIEQLTNKINRYDSLIGYSTVYIDLTEVADPGAGIEQKEGFFKKLGRMFAAGLSNAGENLADLFYWISYNFVGILIFAAVVFCLIKFRPFTKLFRKLFKKEK